jgi:hypothetical protein
VTPSVVLAILRRELRDVLRDRRTLITNFVMPIVFYPLLMIGMAALGKAERNRLNTTSLPVVVREDGKVLSGVRSFDGPRGILGTLRRRQASRSVDPRGSERGARGGEVLAIIDIPGDLAKRVREGVATEVGVTLYTSDPLSGEVLGRRRTRRLGVSRDHRTAREGS